jgi:iron complex outermembrane receptor protein
MKGVSRAAFLAAIASALAVTHTSEAAAAAADAGVTAKDTNGTALQEVVVTARRREELLQNVPIAMQAATGAQLRTLGVFRTEDLKQISPGLVVIPSAFGDSVPTYIIRGQQQGNLWLTADAPVTTYFAEVPLGRFQGSSSGLFDLANVQVLKGPQGTLFGRNTTGGAILIVPQAPTSTFGGFADVSYGDYNNVRLESAVNIPVSDALRIRLAGTLTYHDGFTRNLAGPALDNEYFTGGRLSLTYQPRPWFRDDLVLNGFHEDERPVGFKLTAVNPNGFFALLFPEAVNVPGSYTDFHETSLSSPAPPFGFDTRVDTFTVSNVTSVDLNSSLTFKNIFGFHHVSLYTFNDFDGSSIPLIDSREKMNSDQFSEEIQFQGDALDKHLHYTAGAFYFHEGGDDFQYVYLFGGGAQNAGGAHNIVNQSEAIYAEATYKFDHPAVSITLGARYSWDQRSLNFAAQLYNGPCLIHTTDLGDTIASPCSVPGSASFSKPTFNATVDWKPVDPWLLYVSYKTGYHAGAFDLNATHPGEMMPARPETVDQVELGSKYEWRTSGGISGRLNLALYRDDYKDVQKLVSVLQPNNTFQTLLENAAEEILQGIEADGTVRITDAVELNASYAYIDAYYVSYISPSQGDLSHNRVGSVIPNAATFGLTVRPPIPSSVGHLSVHADAYWQSTYPAGDINVDPVTHQPIHTGDVPSYWTANLRVELAQIMQSRWTLAAYVRNLFDEKYYVNGVDFYTSLGSIAQILGPPRTFGFEARVEF